jgi:hypothetical protein
MAPTITDNRSADLDELLPQRDAARLLGVSERTLEGWRHKISDGPAFVRITARCVRYRRGDLLDFIAAKRRRSTGNASAEAA